MYGNQFRFGIEVADDETKIYQTVAIVDNPMEIVHIEHNNFLVVLYRQNKDGVFVRDSFIDIELTKENHFERTKELIEKIKLINELM